MGYSSGSTHIDDCWIQGGKVVSADSVDIHNPQADDSIPELRGFAVPREYENYSAVITIDWQTKITHSHQSWGPSGGTPEEWDVGPLSLVDAKLVLCQTPEEAVNYVIRGMAEQVITLDPPIAKALFKRYYQKCEADAHDPENHHQRDDRPERDPDEMYDRRRLGESTLNKINGVLRKSINEAPETPEEFISAVGRTWKAAASKGYLAESSVNSFVRQLIDVAANPDAALNPIRGSLPSNYQIMSEDAKSHLALKSFATYWLANKVAGERLNENVPLSEAVGDAATIKAIMNLLGISLVKPDRRADVVLDEDVRAIASQTDTEFDPFTRHLIKLAEDAGYKAVLEGKKEDDEVDHTYEIGREDGLFGDKSKKFSKPGDQDKYDKAKKSGEKSRWQREKTWD